MSRMSEGAKHVLIQGSILGLLAVAAIVAALLLGAGARAEGAAAEPALPERGVFPPGVCCRWELAVAVAGVGEVPAEPAQAAATMLLNQCSGRTWILSRGPRGEFEWVELKRFGPWVFQPGLE